MSPVCDDISEQLEPMLIFRLFRRRVSLALLSSMEDIKASKSLTEGEIFGLGFSIGLRMV